MKQDLVPAYHEAGHAVIADALGAPLRRVQLNKDGSGVTVLDGVVISSKDVDENSSFHVGSRRRQRIERYLVINLAGPYAQRRAAPRSDWRQLQHEHYPGGKTDFSHVSEMIGKVHRGNKKVARHYQLYLEAEAVRLVEENWLLIEHMAPILHARRKMTGKEFKCEIKTFSLAALKKHYHLHH